MKNLSVKFSKFLEKLSKNEFRRGFLGSRRADIDRKYAKTLIQLRDEQKSKKLENLE